MRTATTRRPAGTSTSTSTDPAAACGPVTRSAGPATSWRRWRRAAAGGGCRRVLDSPGCMGRHPTGSRRLIPIPGQLVRLTNRAGDPEGGHIDPWRDRLFPPQLLVGVLLLSETACVLQYPLVSSVAWCSLLIARLGPHVRGGVRRSFPAPAGLHCICETSGEPVRVHGSPRRRCSLCSQRMLGSVSPRPCNRSGCGASRRDGRRCPRPGRAMGSAG